MSALQNNLQAELRRHEHDQQQELAAAESREAELQGQLERVRDELRSGEEEIEGLHTRAAAAGLREAELASRVEQLEGRLSAVGSERERGVASAQRVGDMAEEIRELQGQLERVRDELRIGEEGRAKLHHELGIGEEERCRLRALVEEGGEERERLRRQVEDVAQERDEARAAMVALMENAGGGEGAGASSHRRSAAAAEGEKEAADQARRLEEAVVGLKKGVQAEGASLMARLRSLEVEVEMSSVAREREAEAERSEREQERARLGEEARQLLAKLRKSEESVRTVWMALAEVQSAKSEAETRARSLERQVAAQRDAARLAPAASAPLGGAVWLAEEEEEEEKGSSEGPEERARADAGSEVVLAGVAVCGKMVKQTSTSTEVLLLKAQEELEEAIEQRDAALKMVEMLKSDAERERERGAAHHQQAQRSGMVEISAGNDSTAPIQLAAAHPQAFARSPPEQHGDKVSCEQEDGNGHNSEVVDLLQLEVEKLRGKLTSEAAAKSALELDADRLRGALRRHESAHAQSSANYHGKVMALEHTLAELHDRRECTRALASGRTLTHFRARPSLRRFVMCRCLARVYVCVCARARTHSSLSKRSPCTSMCLSVYR